MYESLTVADGFLELSRERHRALTPMQLLKLVLYRPRMASRAVRQTTYQR
jgi:uncharacterized phage-associated protein